MKHTRNAVSGNAVWSMFPDLAPWRQTVPSPSPSPAAAPAPEAAGRVPAAETAAASPPAGNAKAVTLSFLNMSAFGDLVPRYLAARKSVFIDRLNWDLPSSDGMEFDQYDTPQCRWLIVHEYGEVLAGIRLLPTTARCGIYSYMLRDGQLGHLGDFPTDVLFFEAPVSPQIWEASRLFISGSVPAQRRNHVQYLLMRQMILTAEENLVKHVIGVVPAVWSRWLRRLGLYAVPVGPRFTIGNMSSQAALFNISDQMAWARQGEIAATQ